QQGYVAPEKTIEQKLQESFSKIQHVLTDQKDGSISDENLDFFTENETYNSKAFSANLLNEEAKKIIEEQIELVQELSDEKNMYRVLA
ncbi:hypothetical protein JG666_22310, partial [Vibrio cholerae]|nr:hypothetical protein [Vibrio cholerae]